MELKGYEVQSVSKDGQRAYCIVELTDGTSFGQWVNVGPIEAIDGQIVEQIERQNAAQARLAIAPLVVGLKRGALQV